MPRKKQRRMFRENITEYERRYYLRKKKRREALILEMKKLQMKRGNE